MPIACPYAPLAAYYFQSIALIAERVSNPYRAAFPPCRETPTINGLCFNLCRSIPIYRIVGHAFREDALAASLSEQRLQFRQHHHQQPIEFIRVLTGQQ
jgi:hypothetical protein